MGIFKNIIFLTALIYSPLDASPESEVYYKELQEKPVQIFMETDTLIDVLNSIFVNMDSTVKVSLEFDPPELGNEMVQAPAFSQSVKNHLLLICSSLGAKFEMNGYPPVLKITRVIDNQSRASDKMGLEKWKENIHLRQMLIHPENYPREDVLEFAQNQLQKSDLFRVSKNNLDVMPNEFLAIRFITSIPNAKRRLEDLFHMASPAGKLYILLALNMIQSENYELENVIEHSRDSVGFLDSQNDMITVKPVSTIYKEFIKNGKLASILTEIK
jgi:hypothetical protein